ncbi:MAG: glycosyltransferase [Xanthomonadaceae bacterium]|nr:glycosyltransferase [Xanthomonadaceae bacterium]
MRILLTADPPLPVPPRLYGGIERIVDGLAGALRARGCTVGLLAHPESTCAVDAMFHWPRPTVRGALDHVRNMAALDRAVRAFRPELLHSFSRLAYLGARLPTSLPKLMSFQREPTPRTVRLAPRLGGDSLRFSGCSAYIAERGRRAGGDWSTIPNFFDVARWSAVDVLPADAPLAFLSRLEPVKGAHLAIEIARRAGRRLLVAGNRVEQGDARGYFAREIEPHLDGDRVRWLGEVDDAAKQTLLGGSAGLLLPLQWDEPFGIVMAEALACGTPVVAFRRGAAPEIVRDGIDGFVVDDVDAAVAAVARLPGIDRHACRARAAACFDVAVVAAQYHALYDEMVRA